MQQNTSGVPISYLGEGESSNLNSGYCYVGEVLSFFLTILRIVLYRTFLVPL